MEQYCINFKPTGAFAEYVVTDINTIYKLPDDADLKEYSIVEPTNCCLRAMDLAPIRHGATVCVAGVGGIGSIMLNQILLSGAARITVIEPVEQKRQMALEMGADAVLVNTAIAASGSPSAMAEAFALACRAGRMAYLSGLPAVSSQATATSPLTSFLH